MISMGNVWDRTAEFLSDNLGAILPIALLAIFVPTVISGNFTELQQGATPGLSAVLGLGSLLLALATFWGQLAITALALDPAMGMGVTRTATRRFPAALLLMVAVLLALLASIVPVAIILAANGVDLSGAALSGTMPQIPSGASLWVAIYLLVLAPVLLWVMSRLAVMLPVVVGEGRAFGAVRRSWELTRGVALKIIGVLLLYIIVSTVANLAATSAFGAIMYLVAGREGGGLSLAGVLTTIVGGAVTTAFTVLGTAFTTKLFVALLARDGAAQPR